MIRVNTGNVEYEFPFDHAQIEITGKCNMFCDHCRASNETGVHLSYESIKKVIDFALYHVENINDVDSFRLIISGGEPFLHPDWEKILEYCFQVRVPNIYITSNGSLINEQLVKRLVKYKDKFNNLFVQISLDGLSAEVHDTFRHFRGAFEQCKKAFELLNREGIKYSMRTSLVPNRIDDMENSVKFAIDHKCKRIGFGGVIYHGRAKKDLIMNKDQKKRFIQNIIHLQNMYKDKIEVTTEDPLKFACGYKYRYEKDPKFDINDSSFFGGCTAGITGFDCDSDGNLRPCTVLDIPIVNINDGNIDELTQKYQDSKIIKDLASREFSGKCNVCKLKRLCGGCRAQAYAFSGDYMGDDPTCWM